MTPNKKILALVLAGGNGTRLHPLTNDHSKPALPFAMGHRIIDFVLSNLVNSNITTIHILVQYKPRSLIEYLHTAWAPWRAESKAEIRVIYPDTSRADSGFKGTADAVYQNLHLIEHLKPDLVAVFASDHVYRMDVQQMAAFHDRAAADVTIAAIPVPIKDASSFGVMVTGPGGELLDFVEKPEHPLPIPGDPDRAYASMGNYLFDPAVLVEQLIAAHDRGETDFGRHLLPKLVQNRRVFAYNFADNRVAGVKDDEEQHYWRDIGTLESLAAARLDVQGESPRFRMKNPEWPLLGGNPALRFVNVAPAVEPRSVRLRNVAPKTVPKTAPGTVPGSTQRVREVSSANLTRSPG